MKASAAESSSPIRRAARSGASLLSEPWPEDARSSCGPQTPPSCPRSRRVPRRLKGGPALAWAMKVPLGVRGLDELLGGGVEEGCITLLHGEAGSGKTNLCLLLARNVVRAGRKAIYIDTEGVSLVRLRQMTGDDFDVVIRNILFSEPMTFEEQETLIEKAVKLAAGNDEVGLIVID